MARSRSASRETAVGVLALGLVLCASAGAAPGLGGRDPERIAQFRGGPLHLGLAPGGEAIRLPLVESWRYGPVNVGIHTASKASPVADERRLYVGADNERFYALDLETGALLWRWITRPAKHGIHATAVVDAERVYVADYAGWLTALDKATGTQVWEVKLGGSIGASPTLVGERLYLGVETPDPDGYLAVVDRRTGHRILEGPRLGDHTHATPTVDPLTRRTYLGSNLGWFHAFDGASGRELWKYRVGGALTILPSVRKPDRVHGQIKSTAALAGDRLVFTAWDRSVHCLDAGTGRRHWVVTTRDLAMSSPSVDPEAGLVWVGGHDGAVRCLDLGTGRQRWTYQTGGPVMASPVVVPLEGGGGRAVLIGSKDARLHVLDAARGKPLQTIQAGSAITGEVVVRGGSVYLSTNGGQVLALRSSSGSD